MNTMLTLHDPSCAQDYRRAGIWRSDTLYGLLDRWATAAPDRPALRDALRRLSWNEVRVRVDAVADDLDRAGLRRGDRVSVWLPNRIETAVVFLACSRNGYVCNPSLHQNYTVAEIVELLERLRSAAFVGQVGYGADARDADVFERVRRLDFVKRIYRVGLGDAGTDHIEQAFPKPIAGRAPRSEPITDPDKVVYLAFTSGTTGRPKGVMHSDNTLLANGRGMVEAWGLGPDATLLTLSPLSHHIGTVALEQALIAGCELVVNDPPVGETSFDWLHRTEATYVMGVPTHAMDILAEMRRRNLSSLGKVRTFYMAGSPIPREVARTFVDIGIRPQNIYGMTENGSHQFTRPSDGVDTIVGTCGRACPGYEIRLFRQDEPDVEVGAGEIGEIGGRGGLLMLGYFDDQIATETSFNRGGWFMSGDLGRFDADGNLEIVGRKKDLIIRGGHNIHPARIEDLALTHPGVRVAAAIPVADARLGEKVCLVVSARGEPPTPDDLLRHLHHVGLSKYDMPEYFVIVGDFPLTASGKVLKRSLVDWVKSGRVELVPVRFVPESAPAATRGAEDPTRT